MDFWRTDALNVVDAEGLDAGLEQCPLTLEEYNCLTEAADEAYPWLLSQCQVGTIAYENLEAINVVPVAKKAPSATG